MSKFLVPILNNIVVGPYTIINSFSFNKEVLEQDPSLIMGSLDVDALFTSLPLTETIDICVNELYKDKDVVQNFTKSEMKQLLNLASKDTLFLFDGVYYNQIDGVAMGSPLGPHFANAFMNYHEKIWLDECPLDFKPKYYKRYVDDIFVLFESFEKMEKFKDYLNSKHPKINFTYELEQNGRLPFLDMMIDRNDGKIKTSVYRKPTFTGIYTHFDSFLPSIYKFGLLSTLLFRYFSICSTYMLFHLEIVELKNIFLRNGYPSKFIHESIYKFMNKIFIKKVIKHTVPKKDYTLILPYLGPLSNKIQKRIKNVFQKILPAGNIKLIFKTSKRLSNILKFKDVIPSDIESHIIYHFKCPCGNAGYVGETRMHHIVRSSQHLGISEFTGRPTTAGVQTAITKHIKSNSCNSSLNNFKILGREVDYHRRHIKESLFIKYYDYDLNKQQTSTQLFLF